MSIWDRMNKITQGNSPEEIPELKHGDVVKGIITNIVQTTPNKKGGYGFISSPTLPFERIFFHWSGLQQATLRFPALKRRMDVEFQLQHDKLNGYRAIKIKVLE